VPSLLVTNDFPPKHGGIQSYLYELWRRLPPEETTVLTTPYDGAAAWDAEQAFRVERARQRVLLPSRRLARDVDALAREVAADVVFLDPMLPLGLIGPRLRAAPYAVIAHGAEITGYGRIPGVRALGGRVMRGAAAVVAAGGYPARESNRIAGRSLQGVVIPPGVDIERFRPIDDDARATLRRRIGIDPRRPMVLGLSRLVPRKGFDIVIDALAQRPAVQLVIAGAGRDRRRLERRAAARGAGNVRFLGRVDDVDVPALYASADAFAMCCRERWGGMEAEGFGIVFLEAAACGVPAIAGRSGGSHEAVADGESGFVVEPDDVNAVTRSLDRLLTDDALRQRMGNAARRRAVEDFSYDRLVETLRPIARGDFSHLALLSG
jgi:phosphatidylinositol alpha-1,6-mannosyltransferase